MGMVAVLNSTRAEASLVYYDFSGTVSPSVDYSGLSYVPAPILAGGVPFIGTLSFDNSASPVSSTSSSAVYRGTDLDMTMPITIDGSYTYAISTPASDDEIDTSGTDFELFKRGPTVYTSFAPNPPFSHLDFEATTTSSILSEGIIGIGSPFDANGLSDQQTSGAGYYYINLTPSSLQEVPEPSALTAMAIGLAALSMRRRAL
jgi:hypothetical protein